MRIQKERKEVTLGALPILLPPSEASHRLAHGALYCGVYSEHYIPNEIPTGRRVGILSIAIAIAMATALSGQ